MPFDSQAAYRMPVHADFYHIDGDHTTNGVIHDLDICYAAANPGATLLIDDYDHIPAVRRGVDKWLKLHDKLEHKYVKSFRGEIVIVKEKPND